MSTRSRRVLARLAVAAALLAGAPLARAGIPVIDVSNLIQSIQAVLNTITQIENQLTQIEQAGRQLDGINGSRGLGSLLRNPLLTNYVPANAGSLVDGVARGGYGGLSGAAKALRDADMLYNCLDKSGDARTACQASLNRPDQTKALLRQAMDSASGRMTQVNGLIDRINATTDQKSILELQARLAGENAMLQHEMSRIQLLAGMAENEARLEAARRREAAAENLTRPASMSSLLD